VESDWKTRRKSPSNVTPLRVSLIAMLPGTAAVKACGNAGRWEQALQLVEDLRCGRVMDLNLNIKVAMKTWGIAGIAMYNQQVGNGNILKDGRLYLFMGTSPTIHEG